MERILKNGEPDVKTDLAACYGIKAEKILRIAVGKVGRTYWIDHRYLLKIYDTDTAAGKTGLAPPAVLGRVLEPLPESGLRGRICPSPRPGEGRLFYVPDPGSGALFSFIPGEAVGDGKPYNGGELQELFRGGKELHGLPGEGFSGICPTGAF